MSHQLSIKQTSSNSRAVRSRMALNLALCLTFLVLALGTVSRPLPVECQEMVTVESRQQKDADELTDTINYLESLDKYYSQIARPRFGRSQYKQPVGFMGAHLQREAFGGPDGGQFASRPSALPMRFNSLADLINSRLAKKYAKASF